MSSYKLAILDDYAGLAMQYEDWTKVKSLGVEITVFHETIHDEDKLVERLEPFHIILAMRERTPFPATLLARLPNLKYLNSTAMHNRGIDFGYAKSQGIYLAGTRSWPGATTELAWALILGLCRKTATDHARVMRGAGQAGKEPWQGSPGIGLRGKWLGLLGIGRLGKEMVPIAKAFGMNITAWSPNLTPERAAEAGVDFSPTFDAFLSKAEVLSIHMVNAPSTHHLLNSDAFKKINPSCVIINTSRGGLVDTDAVVEALKEDRIRGYATDVYESEPLLLGNPFDGLAEGKVLLMPHMGYSTEETLKVFWKDTRENVESWIEKGEVHPDRVI